MGSMLRQRRRSAIILGVVALTLAAVLALPITRILVLQSLARTLVEGDRPIEPVDIIVVSVDSGGGGVLEAADLVSNGVSSQVAIFAAAPGRVDLELLRRGIPYEDSAARSIRQLRSLGVADIVQLPRVSGTEEAGRFLPDWCDQHAFRSIMVVTSWHHSRRVRRTIERYMRGHATMVFVRKSRYADVDPDTWWQTREGLRTGAIELEKLLLDFVLHPIQWPPGRSSP